MKTTINLLQFRQAFFDMGRHNQFSSEGLEVLFNYLEELENEVDEEMELDVIGFCCNYAEETPQQIADNYGHEFDKDTPIEEQLDDFMEWLEGQAIVCGTTKSGTIVYQPF